MNLNVPPEISKRTLPPLPISKRKLPSLPQSKTTLYKNKCNAVNTKSISTTVKKSRIRVMITNIHNRISSPKSSPTKIQKISTFDQFPSIKSKWKPSLEFIFIDKQLLHKLKQYMILQHNEENLLFLQCVYKLNVLIDNLLLFSSDLNIIKHTKINNLITLIFDEYIQTNADKQINLSYASFANVICHQYKFQNYSLTVKRDLFKECMVEIERLIQMSILTGFYMSEYFQSVARQRKIFCNDSFHLNTPCNNEYLLSSQGYSFGIHEWKIEILQCHQNTRQEFGIISRFDENIKMHQNGICDTEQFGARALYGYNHFDDSFYYASYNKDNSIRCNKDLSQLSMHQTRLCRGSVIKIILNCEKGKIRFYLNGKQVRKAVSIEKGPMYYPIILFSGDCKYRIS